MQSQNGLIEGTTTYGNGQGTVDPAAAPTSAIAHEAHNFLADIEDLITSMTSLTGEDLARAKARFSARLAAARASVEEMGGALADQARTTAKATDGYVRERPWQAVGIGVGFGVLVGILFARR